MPTVADIVRSLSEITQPESAASWDPVGLQLGDSTAEVTTIAVCHEVTEEVVAAAKERAVDLLISYHPLLFAPVNRLIAGRSPQARALALIEDGTNLVITHTDFDACEGGAADALAEVLQLRDIEPFGADEQNSLPPIGRVGDFDLSLDALDARVSDLFGANGLRISGDRSQTLHRVAVVPGSGSDLISEAAVLADALVTGDVSHHRARRALDLGLAIVDPGHIATERPGMKALVRLVSDIADVEVVDLTGIDPTTWS